MKKDQFIQQLTSFLGFSVNSNECPKGPSPDNLYLVSGEYFGRYEDDDCSFVYINSETGEIEHKSWTTRGACPSFTSYYRMKVLDAVEVGYVSKQMWYDYCEKRWYNYCKDIVDGLKKDITMQSFWKVYKNNPGHSGLYQPCTVSNRCRSYKGSGILLTYADVYDSYYEKYYPMAKVYGSDGKIYTINPKHVTVDMTVMCEWWDKKLQLGISDTDELYMVCFDYSNIDNILNMAEDVYETERKNKYKELKEKKMLSLIEWCKEKDPEKSDIDIRIWAERIFSKKYPFKF